VLVGVATLFKQPAYPLGAALAVWGASRVAPPHRLRWTLTFTAGVVLVQVGLVAWLRAHGAISTFAERVFAQGIQRGYADGFSVAGRIREWISLGFAPMPALLTAGVVALASRHDLATRAFACVFVLPVAAIGCLSYELYDHYLIPALPALCLLVAEWLASTGPHRRRQFAMAGVSIVQGLSLVVFALGVPRPGSDADRILDVWRRRPLSLTYQRRVAAFVVNSTSPEEPILSTGTDIPYLASRRNAYRYLELLLT
jgi:hypothetical protein